MYYSLKQFFKRIYNLYRWFPIIWKDQDWDQHYIYEIFKFKLRNQAEHIGGNNRHLRAKRDAEIMLLCCRLIDKVNNEDYINESHECQQAEFNVEDNGYLKVKVLHEDYTEFFKKYRKSRKQVMSMKKPIVNTDTDYGVALSIGILNHNRAKKLLFSILEKNISLWWD
jgi:hypothetical protein